MDFLSHEVVRECTRAILLEVNAVEPEGSDSRRLPKGGPEVAGLEVEEAAAGPEGQLEGQVASTVGRLCWSNSKAPSTVGCPWCERSALIETDQERWQW